jgi:FHS family glucose/mannose:H+ symporter-like MFS transporter
MFFTLKFFFVVSAYLSLFCLGMSDNLRGPVFVEILNHYHLTQTQGSWLWATASFFGFFGSFFYPLLSRKLRIEFISPVMLVLIALAWFVIGLPAVSYSVVLLSSAFFGISLGVIGVHINVLIHQGVTAKEQSPYFSGLHSMYALSSLVAPLVVVFVHWIGAHWRFSFDLVALFSLLSALLLWIGCRNKRLKPFFEVEKRADVRNDQRLEHSKSRWIFVLLFAVVLGGYVVAEIMISSRLATYLRQENGMDLSTSSTAAALFFLGLFLTRGAMFFFPLRIPAIRQLLISNFLSIALILLGVTVHPFFLLLTGLSMGLFYPISMVYLSDKFPHAMSNILSKTQALQALMIMGMHLMMGFLADHFGMRLSFLYGLIFLILSSGCLVLFEKIYKTSVLKEEYV